MHLIVRLLRLFRPYWLWLLGGSLIALVTVLANVALMGLSGWFITAMGIAGVTGTALNYFTPAAVIRACAILRTGGRYAERIVTHEATFRLIARLRVWLYRRMEPQDAQSLSRFHSGDVLSRLRADVDRLETAYLRLFAPLLAAVAGAIAIVVWLGGYGAGFVWVEAMGLLLAGIVLPAFLASAAARLGRRHVHLTALLRETVVDGVRGLPDLLAYGAQDAHQARFAALSLDLVKAQAQVGRLTALSQAGLQLGGNLALWGTVVVGIPLVRAGGLAPADLVMLVLVALAGFETVAPLPGAFLAIGGVVESARRIFALADAAPQAGGDAEMRSPPPPPSETTAPTLSCDLRVADLGYRYADDGPAVLAGLSLDLPPGRRVALVGPTGAGKSTLVLLLTGLLAPTSGQILLNAQPLVTYDGEAVRRHFAVMLQGGGLFSGTVRDILRLGRQDATDAQIWDVLATVGLADEVLAFPDGLDTWLGEAGLTVSGGQARRLAVARALLRDAPILILDEPCEGLDYRTERAMLAAIVAGLRGRSLLLITHRAAGLDLMDAVVSLERS